MSTLLISLPMAHGPDTGTLGADTAPSYSYVLSPDGEAISQQGSTTVGLLPQPGRTGEVVAVVPAAMLSWQRAPLPQGVGPSSPRLRAVLEGMLEEHLLDDPAQLHFALQPDATHIAAGEPVWIACCPRAWLREHLQNLESAGRAVGCLFLILGVFAMLYVRDRRVWIWLAPRADGSTDARMALSTNRKTMDVDREFEGLSEKLLGVKPVGGQ